jgi:glucokinase
MVGNISQTGQANSPPAPQMSFTHNSNSVNLGIDVGGTEIKGCLLTESAIVLGRSRWATSDARDASMVDVLSAHVFELASVADSKGFSVAGVGLVVPGLVDEAAQVALEASNFAWRDTPLPKLLHETTGLSVSLGHDSRSGCLAEVKHGAARNRNTVLFVPIGSGIGSSLSIAGAILAEPWVGEIGHCIVDPTGEVCACGEKGCLETIASARGIGRAYQSLTGRRASSEEIAQLVSKGDPQATVIWTRAVEMLASVLAPCIALTAPEVVVIGGGLSTAGPTLISPLNEAIDRRLALTDGPPVVQAAFGRWSACIGAALLSQDSSS